MKTQLRKRLENFLEWSAVDRCILLALIVLPFPVVNYVSLSRALEDSQARTLFNARYMGWFIDSQPIIAALWLGVFVVAVLIRKHYPQSRPLIYFATQLYALSTAFLLYGIGTLTSPVGIVVAGSFVAAALLFGWRPAAWALGSALLVLAGLTVAERAGAIPYAPLLASSPFSGGRLDNWWFAFIGSTALLFLINTLLITGFIFYRLKDREERLARAKDDLELRVRKRTEELEQANSELRQEIASRRRLEAHLVEVRKMEAIGRLAGGFAHEFNNLLSIIMGHTGQLRRSLAPGDPLLERPAAIQRASERGALLIRQLLAYSRKQPTQRQVVDLNQLSEEVGRLLRPTLGETVQLELVGCSEKALAEVDASQIDQVLINLALNAKHAMPRGGILRIETERVALSKYLEGLPMSVPPGNYIRIRVSDTGSGIPENIRGRVFDPFFTTKPVGEGTGMGLAMVHGAVQQNDGYVLLQDGAGKGAVFDLYFPQIEGGKAMEKNGESAQTAIEEGKTIVVAEDEPELREMVCETLKEAGYTVVSGNDSKETLRLALLCIDRLDLLVTDVVMPDLDGPTLAAALREERADLPVLFVSGYPSHQSVGQGQSMDGAKFLPKPFTPSELLDQLQRLFEETADSPRKGS